MYDAEKLQSLVDCLRGIERMRSQIISFEFATARHLSQLRTELERLERLRAQLTADLEHSTPTGSGPGTDGSANGVGG